MTRLLLLWGREPSSTRLGELQSWSGCFSDEKCLACAEIRTPDNCARVPIASHNATSAYYVTMYINWYTHVCVGVGWSSARRRRELDTSSDASSD
jgi:hypothetical protein